MDVSVLVEKLSFKSLGLSFSSKFDSYTAAIAKTASKKIGTLIGTIRFFLLRLLFICKKNTIRPYIKYCCHVLACASSYYLDMLGKLQKRICRTVGPLHAASHHRSSSTCSHIKYFLQVLLWLMFIWTGWTDSASLFSWKVHLLCWRFLDFSATLSRRYKDVYAKRFFPRAVRLWNSLSAECFPLNYDLTSFIFRFLLRRIFVCF